MWPFFMTTKLGLLALRGNNCILLYKVTIKLLGMTNEKGKQGTMEDDNSFWLLAKN